jgi:hypothetical protein
VATVEPGSPVFPLPKDKGSRLLRYDLKAAGIPYRDASGRFFDFHSFRCETATLLDVGGVTPRVVQRIMRHSSLDLTGRYTRPRAVDIEAAASMFPSLKPEAGKPESLALTGTDPRPILLPMLPRMLPWRLFMRLTQMKATCYKRVAKIPQAFAWDLLLGVMSKIRFVAAIPITASNLPRSRQSADNPGYVACGRDWPGSGGHRRRE